MNFLVCKMKRNCEYKKKSKWKHAKLFFIQLSIKFLHKYMEIDCVGRKDSHQMQLKWAIFNLATAERRMVWIDILCDVFNTSISLRCEFYSCFIFCAHIHGFVAVFWSTMEIINDVSRKNCYTLFLMLTRSTIKKD